MIGQLLKAILVSELRTEGQKLRSKDTNNTGNDDAGGRALEAIAAGVDTIDISGVTNPKSLKSIGTTFVAVGQKLIDEANNAAAGN